MKIRTGFVSNSSSSSFCLIGTENKKICRALLNKFFKDEDEFQDSDGWGGQVVKGDFVFCGSEYDYVTVGIEAEPLLEKMTIPEAKEVFKNLVKKEIGITPVSDQIKFSYGETSSG